MASVSVTSSATQILSEANRKVAMIQNLGPADMYIGWDNSVTTSNGIKVASGKMLNIEDLPVNPRKGGDQNESDTAVFGITVSGTADVRYLTK